VGGGRANQSLKDDSLSELSSSCSSKAFLPPPGTGASGVLKDTKKKKIYLLEHKQLIIIQTVTINLYTCMILFTVINTYSSKLGSKPSNTILFLMAIAGTPCEHTSKIWAFAYTFDMTSAIIRE